MRTPLFYIALVLLLAAQLCSMPLAAQDSSTYKLEFVRAGQVGSQDHPMTVVVFKVTPLVPDFMPVLSMKITYDIGNGEQVVDILKNDNVRMTVYGNDVESKSKKVYEFVKDIVDLPNEKDIFLLRIDFRHLSTEAITAMTVKYGLWEGADNGQRIEQEFAFVVEDLR